MNDPDQLTLDDIEFARAFVSRRRLVSVAVSFLGALLFSAVCFAATLWQVPGDERLALVVALTGFLPTFVTLVWSWLARWRKIDKGLRDLAMRIEAGEILHGSKVRLL